MRLCGRGRHATTAARLILAADYGALAQTHAQRAQKHAQRAQRCQSPRTHQNSYVSHAPWGPSWSCRRPSSFPSWPIDRSWFVLYRRIPFANQSCTAPCTHASKQLCVTRVAAAEQRTQPPLGQRPFGWGRKALQKRCRSRRVISVGTAPAFVLLARPCLTHPRRVSVRFHVAQGGRFSLANQLSKKRAKKSN